MKRFSNHCFAAHRNTHKGETKTGSFGFSEIVSGYLNLASGMTPDALKVDAGIEEAAGEGSAGILHLD